MRRTLVHYEIFSSITTLKQHLHVGIFQGVGRKKCLDDRRQHSSHFCLCHDGGDSSTEEAGGNFTAYQTDFRVKQAVNVPASTRRFPCSHKQKSAEAALAQAGEQFMWFGRHDSDLSETLQVLAATNCSTSSKPWDTLTFKALDGIIEGTFCSKKVQLSIKEVNRTTCLKQKSRIPVKTVCSSQFCQQRTAGLHVLPVCLQS